MRANVVVDLLHKAEMNEMISLRKLLCVFLYLYHPILRYSKYRYHTIQQPDPSVVTLGTVKLTEIRWSPKSSPGALIGVHTIKVTGADHNPFQAMDEKTR